MFHTSWQHISSFKCMHYARLAEVRVMCRVIKKSCSPIIKVFLQADCDYVGAIAENISNVLFESKDHCRNSEWEKFRILAGLIKKKSFMHEPVVTIIGMVDKVHTSVLLTNILEASLLKEYWLQKVPESGNPDALLLALSSGCATVTYSKIAIIPMGSVLEVLKHMKADLSGDFNSYSRNLVYAKWIQESIIYFIKHFQISWQNSS